MSEIASLPPEAERVLLQPAVVLHRRPYRETSFLVDILAEQQGRVRVLAKGARRRRQAAANLLQPFIGLSLSWSGRGNLPVLTHVEATGGTIRELSGDALFCGLYLNELLLHLLPPRDPHPEVFRAYAGLLQDLGRLGRDQREAALRGFELLLLEQIGYGLCLDRDRDGHEIEPAKHYHYRPEEGPVEVPGEALLAIRGSTLLGLARRHLTQPEQLREAKRLLRGILQHRLNGRELASRRLFRAPSISDSA